MSQQPTTREELYERIRNSSKDEVILEEMIRLGFWPAQGQVPNDPADEIRERGQLEKRLADLRARASKLYNEKQLLAEARKKRLENARKRRQETKDARERARQEKAARWAERKKRELVYLGEGVSGGLGARKVDPDRLAGANLPALASPEALAAAMQVGLGELRFLAFHRSVSRISHYRRFTVPKKTGGLRTIAAPMPRLKGAQRWILQHILDRVPVHEAAHGFLTMRSIVTNATPHVGADVLINIDLADFFPTVTYARVKGMFCGLGYSESAATVLSLLCTEPDTDLVELDGVRYHVAKGPRRLPQGSPASPAITNILCRRLDRRLTGLARSLGFTYTRYADDLTFSARGPQARGREVGSILRGVADIVAHEGFTVHEGKTRVMWRGRRLEVTGIVVNDKLSVDRATLRRFRATLRQVELDGVEGKRWGDARGRELWMAMHGYASFVSMVDPRRGRPLLERVRALRGRYGPPTGGGGRPPTPRSPAPEQQQQPPPSATAAPQVDRPAPAPASSGGASQAAEPAPKKPKKPWKLW